MARNKTSIEEKYNAPFPTALRALMEERGETQENIAKAAGKTRQTISQYVNGISEPGYDVLIRIADYFDVSIDYLLGRTEDPSRQSYAVDALGLYPDTVSWIVGMKEDVEAGGVLGALLEIPSVRDLISKLSDYYFAVQAEKLYDNIWLDFFAEVNDLGRVERVHSDDVLSAFNDELDKIAKSEHYGQAISSLLSIHRRIWETTVHDCPQDGPFARDGFGVKELYSMKVNQCIKDVLSDICFLALFGPVGQKPVVNRDIRSCLTQEFDLR